MTTKGATLSLVEMYRQAQEKGDSILAARPDILLLVLDTQRVDHLSCYGYPVETSPHIDALAADATRFEHAYAAAQWTVPSHTSMFTGLYPGRHSMFHASSKLPPTMTTLAERLGQAGYFTAAFCNNPLIGVVNTGLQRGFQSFLNYSGWLTSRPNQAGTTRKSLTDSYRRHFKRFLASIMTTMQDVFARSDFLLDLSFSPLMAPLWQTALSFKGNTQRSLNDAAKLLIERKGLERDQPAFAFINVMGVHTPFHPAPQYARKFAPQLEDKAARRYLRRFNSDVFGWLAPLNESINEEHKVLLDSVYNAEIARQDEQVGNFFQKLRDSGTLDNTLVMICADHGDMHGEKELMGHSISVYNPLVHVPLIIRDPEGNLARGTTMEHVVSTRRIFHTALTAAKAATQYEQAHTLIQSAESDPEQGRIFSVGVTPQNLVNVMRRRNSEILALRRCDEPRRAVWDGRYKLIQTGDDELELYDIFDDPGEEINLRDILPEQVEILQQRLQGFMKATTFTEAPEEITADASDPHVYRRLHDLGYLE